MITNALEYKEVLRNERVLEFMQTIIIGLQNYDAKTFFSEQNVLLESQRLLHDLDEIDNADFERGDIDDAPF